MARRGVDGAELTELLSLSQEEFSARLEGSPIKCAKRRGLLRNAAVALGNRGAPEAVPALTAQLRIPSRWSAAMQHGRWGDRGVLLRPHRRHQHRREPIPRAIRTTRRPVPLVSLLTKTSAARPASRSVTTPAPAAASSRPPPPRARGAPSGRTTRGRRRRAAGPTPPGPAGARPASAR